MKNEKMIESFRVLLRQSGLKSTEARLSVLSVLASSRKPIRIKDIEKKLITKKIDIDTVTIYRVMETFCVKGITKRVHVEEGAACYELHTNDHHHITCTGCKRQEDIEVCLFKEHEARIRESIPGFASVTRHSIEFFGLCGKCAAKI